MKHSQPKNKTHSGFFNYLQYIFIRLSIGLIKLLPLEVAYKLGEKIGWICWKLMTSRRITVENNLSIAWRWISIQGNLEHNPINSLSVGVATREVFCRNAANLLSSFSFSALTIKKRVPLIEFENLEVLKAAVDRGEGVVLLMAHMGPWELISCFPGHFEQLGITARLGVIYRPLENGYIEKWYRSQRKIHGMELFKRKAGLLEVFKFIKKGEILAVLADQRVSNGEMSEFFGKPALTSPLVGLFSKKSSATVVSLTLKYDRTCKLKAAFRLVKFEGSETREEYAKITNQELEKVLCSDLTSGFWFHKRFKM